VRGPKAIGAEVIIGMAAVIGICYIVRPSDPLLLDLGFPWIWLAATVFALRYGVLWGGGAGLCIVAAWYVFYGDGRWVELPMMFMAGGFVQVIVAGHFYDMLAQRISRLREVNRYLDGRLVSLTHNHYLLRVSHERLERDLLLKPSTLRDSVRYLRGLSSSDAQGDFLPNAQSVLEFAASSCQIEVGSIFPGNEEGFSRWSVASVGERFELDVDDPLVSECFEKHALVHLRQIDTQESAYLACVPLIAESGKLRGVLVIRRMPFLSLNLDNLQLLLVLFDYYTDGVEQNTLIAAVQQAVPECPFEFALELGRLGRMRQISGVCSSLVALVFPRGAIGESLYDQTLRQHRALDLYWTYDIEQVRVILILKPLADDNGVNGYLLRLEDNFWKQFDTDLAEAHVAVHSAGVDSVEPGIGLQKLLERCQHHG
jgi:hypothetical protein